MGSAGAGFAREKGTSKTQMHRATLEQCSMTLIKSYGFANLEGFSETLITQYCLRSRALEDALVAKFQDLIDRLCEQPPYVRAIHGTLFHVSAIPRPGYDKVPNLLSILLNGRVEIWLKDRHPVELLLRDSTLEAAFKEKFPLPAASPEPCSPVAKQVTLEECIETLKKVYGRKEVILAEVFKFQDIINRVARQVVYGRQIENRFVLAFGPQDKYSMLPDPISIMLKYPVDMWITAGRSWSVHSLLVSGKAYEEFKDIFPLDSTDHAQPLAKAADLEPGPAQPVSLERCADALRAMFSFGNKSTPIDAAIVRKFQDMIGQLCLNTVYGRQIDPNCFELSLFSWNDSDKIDPVEIVLNNRVNVWVSEGRCWSIVSILQDASKYDEFMKHFQRKTVDEIQDWTKTATDTSPWLLLKSQVGVVFTLACSQDFFFWDIGKTFNDIKFDWLTHSHRGLDEKRWSASLGDVTDHQHKFEADQALADRHLLAFDQAWKAYCQSRPAPTSETTIHSVKADYSLPILKAQGWWLEWHPLAKQTNKFVSAANHSWLETVDQVAKADPSRTRFIAQ